MTRRIILPPIVQRPSPNQSVRRDYDSVRLIVAHRWASPVAKTKPKAVATYNGVVGYLQRPSVQASAHVVYGGSLVDEAAQLVPWDRKAWHACAFNSISEGIEYADAIWSGDDPEGLKVAARIHAFRLHVRGLPAVWVKGEALSHGGKGLTRHLDLGSLGGGHTDPTTSVAVWEGFVERVKHELERGGFRKHWGRS